MPCSLTLRVAAVKLLIIQGKMVAAAGAPHEAYVVVVVVAVEGGVPKVHSIK